jgi:hypothetical protein
MTTNMCKPHGKPETFAIVKTFGTGALATAMQAPACPECVEFECWWMEQNASGDEASRALTVTLMPRCQRCHAPLIGARELIRPGRPRVWCSETCRKASGRQQSVTGSEHA